MEGQIRLHGRVFIRGEIKAETGLHIGGSGGVFAIGGVDNPIIVDAITGEPYIPGSSLRGKMRSLTEKYLGLSLSSQARILMHICSKDDYADCAVGNIYGIPAEDFSLPTRLMVRDVPLTPEAREHLLQAKTALPFSEIKTEVSIDRVTSQANPRDVERVPAGAVFGPMEMVYNVYIERDVEWFSVLIEGMELLQDDYLGGHGSRGSGKVSFQNLTLSLKRTDNYREPIELGEFKTLAHLSAAVRNLQEQIWAHTFGGV